MWGNEWYVLFSQNPATWDHAKAKWKHRLRQRNEGSLVSPAIWHLRGATSLFSVTALSLAFLSSVMPNLDRGSNHERWTNYRARRQCKSTNSSLEIKYGEETRDSSFGSVHIDCFRFVSCQDVKKRVPIFFFFFFFFFLSQMWPKVVSIRCCSSSFYSVAGHQNRESPKVCWKYHR